MKKLSLEQMEIVNGMGAGQRTMDCIQDAYSKHGWFSIALSVATAFDPMIALAAAAGCSVVGVAKG